MAYDGLGALRVAANDELADGASETYKVDAIGNRLRTTKPAASQSDPSGARFQSYDENARLVQVVDSSPPPPDDYHYTANYEYDATGAQFLQYEHEQDVLSDSTYDATRSYVSADDKLSVIDRHEGLGVVPGDAPGHHSAYQENWYDALGRRVLVRARKAPTCNSVTYGELECKSFIERSVWDGQQVLLERRADGAASLTSAQLDQETSIGGTWGEVISLLGSGIDAPLAVRKTFGTTLVPHENWSGSYEIGTTADGTPTSLCNGATNCPLVLWPGSQETMDREIVTHEKLATWWGSLITDKLDATGLKYMRNRYYNPVNGQFTQQDPIGLAGGANLYGFAGGDPVNFGDPFGLCPEWLDRKPCDLNALASFAAGFGDVVSFGVTNWVRDKMGTNDVVDKKGGAYFAGQVSGQIADLAAGGTVLGAAVDFLVTAKGIAVPVPTGAVGPSNTEKPGMQFVGGAGGHGLDSRVTGVRVMDANKNQERRVLYMNKNGQTVSLKSGKTVSNDDPQAHHPIHE